MKRRLIPAVVLAALAAPFPLAAHATSWKPYTNRALGLSVRYPAHWQLAATVLKNNGQLTLVHRAKAESNNRNFTVRMLDIKPQGSPVADEARMAKSDPSLKRISWSSTKVGGRAAVAGVARPPTEGGVTIADAVYFTETRSHVYEIFFVAYQKPAPSSLSQFPSEYRVILNSIHFI